MPEDRRQILGQNLSYILEKRGKTQNDIVRDLEVSTGAVSSWVNGKKYPRIDVLQKLCDYLDVRMSVLTEENGKSVFIAEESERLLLTAWRAADDRAREDALKTLLDHPRKKDIAEQVI